MIAARVTTVPAAAVVATETYCSEGCASAAACAVLAGARSLTTIAEWAADASDRLLSCCGVALRDPDRPCWAPSEATVRRVLQRIDGDAFDAAIGGWLTDRAADQDGYPPARPVRAAVAVDGKSLRGAICADGRCVRLISALRDDGIVLAQREVDAKSNEITVFRPLLDPVDLTGAGDAAHADGRPDLLDTPRERPPPPREVAGFGALPADRAGSEGGDRARTGTVAREPPRMTTPSRYHLLLAASGRPVQHGWWGSEETARDKFRRWVGKYGSMPDARLALIDERDRPRAGRLAMSVLHLLRVRLEEADNAMVARVRTGRGWRTRMRWERAS